MASTRAVQSSDLGLRIWVALLTTLHGFGAVTSDWTRSASFHTESLLINWLINYSVWSLDDVSTVTSLGAGTSGVRVPVGAKRFFTFTKRQNRFWAPFSFQYTTYRSFFFEWSCRAVMFPSDFHLAPKLIMRGAIPLPPIRLRVLRSDTFAVAFILSFDVGLSELLTASLNKTWLKE